MAKVQAAPVFKVMPDPLEDRFRADTALQDAVDEAVQILPEHGFAIVDLSDDPVYPRYAGYQDTLHRPIGSLAKLLSLYGAFELRRNLRGALMDYGAPDLPTLAQQFRANLVSVKGTAGSRPLIEKLFALSPDGSDLDFTFGGPPERYTDQLLGLAHDLIDTRITRTTRPNPVADKPRITRLDEDPVLSEELKDLREQGKAPAQDQLRLMAGWSDNVSAAIVTEALGFPYLWALTNHSALFRKSWPPLTRNDDPKGSGRGGLCLTSDYNYGAWRKRPAGVPGSPTQAGTARSIAVLMTKLALGVLVDGPSSFEMREMMRKAGPGGLASPPAYRGETSTIGQGMLQAGWSAGQHEWSYDASTTLPQDDPLAVSKVGYYGQNVTCNALIVRTRRDRIGGGQKPITVVLVAMDWIDANDDVPKEFGKAMAAALETKHNLVKQPPANP